MDKETERFVRSRMEGTPKTGEPTLDDLPAGGEGEAPSLPFRILEKGDVRPYLNAVPLYDLKVAAGLFSKEQYVAQARSKKDPNTAGESGWVELPDAFRPQQGLFVAQVVGESMNRRIPNGAWCLFRLNPAGTRQGKVVLVQHREIQDQDTGGHYTVKVYESEKKVLDDGTWRHVKIRLKPDTNAPGYEPIEISNESAEELRIIAELVAVLG